ncbi:ArnT family glycosyltransferase [Lutibacter holmesii]|uniref:ArnT family glycosyltransferase n=1 Tax=Lutibacter holmesii TaxID=1137985 RepID=A0ABW3WKP1_9FLAO
MLGSWGLTDSSEARYAEIGKEMYMSKDYINPTLLGIKHLHKPPVTYYLTALGYQLFGVNEFAARFFMQVALIFQLFFVFKITLLLYKNEKLAFTATLIYFSLPIAIIAVRTLTTDAYLTTFILASIYFWLQYKQQQKTYLLYLFYLFLGLIFETKGPVGFIVPLTFIITYKIIYKDKIETTIHQFLGFILFLIVAASWYVLAIKNNEGLLDYFFNNQLVERVTKNKFNRAKPFYYYLLLIPVLGLPWVFYLFLYFKKNIKTIIQEKKTDFILIVTFLVFLLILSLSTSKLILYIFPTYFIIAIFSAKNLSHCSAKNIQLFSKIYLFLIGLITCSIVVLAFLNLNLGFEIHKIYALIILVISISFSITISKKIANTNYLKPTYLGVVFIISVILSANYLFKDNELKINSVKPLAKFIQENSQTKPKVIVYSSIIPALPFYLNQKIITIKHHTPTTQRETQFETSNAYKEHLIDYFTDEGKERVSNMNLDEPTYLVVRKRDTIPTSVQLFINKFKHKKVLGKHLVYY